MLQLSTKPTPTKTVNLAGGATVAVRPATTFEFDLAVARAGKLLAGLIQSHESAASALDYLGSDFIDADFTAPEWLEAAAKRIILIDLAVACVVSWSGFVDDGGRIIESPSRPMLALLLRSASSSRPIENAIRADINVEFDEKNALGASPTGEAPAADNTAENAVSKEATALAGL
jgi:hypothetical protein